MNGIRVAGGQWPLGPGRPGRPVPGRMGDARAAARAELCQCPGWTRAGPGLSLSESDGYVPQSASEGLIWEGGAQHATQHVPGLGHPITMIAGIGYR